MLKYILLIILVSSVSLANSFDRLVTVHKFNQANKYVEQLVKQKGAKHVLLVFDDDNTLATMPQPLGSVGWWDWQMHLLKHNPKSPQLVAHNFHNLLQIQILLFDMSRVKLTSVKIPLLLNKWQKQGVTTMIETDRSHGFISDTNRQLTNVGLLGAQNKVDFAKHAVVAPNGMTSLPGDFYPCNDKSMRKIAYQSGILFVGGQNKGKLMICLLKRLKQSKKYTGILFIDDKLQNDQDFHHAYQPLGKKLDIYSVHYTKENAKQFHITSSARLHRQMTVKWQKIVKVMRLAFAKPNLPIGN